MLKVIIIILACLPLVFDILIYFGGKNPGWTTEDTMSRVFCPRLLKSAAKSATATAAGESATEASTATPATAGSA